MPIHFIKSIIKARCLIVYLIATWEEILSELIDIKAYPIRELLPILLMDKTTGKNIIWATDAYEELGPGYDDKNIITAEAITGEFVLQPRISKTLEAQQARTRKRAEVMTPVWLCNKMNNYLDEQWFGRKDVFNHENEDHTWSVTEGKIDSLVGMPNFHAKTAQITIDAIAAAKAIKLILLSLPKSTILKIV